MGSKLNTFPAIILFKHLQELIRAVVANETSKCRRLIDEGADVKYARSVSIYICIYIHITWFFFRLYIEISP